MQILCYEVRISVSGVGESAAASLVRKFPPFKNLKHYVNGHKLGAGKILNVCLETWINRTEVMIISGTPLRLCWI